MKMMVVDSEAPATILVAAGVSGGIMANGLIGNVQYVIAVGGLEKCVCE